MLHSSFHTQIIRNRPSSMKGGRNMKVTYFMWHQCFSNCSFLWRVDGRYGWSLNMKLTDMKERKIKTNFWTNKEENDKGKLLLCSLGTSASLRYSHQNRFVRPSVCKRLTTRELLTESSQNLTFRNLTCNWRDKLTSVTTGQNNGHFASRRSCISARFSSHTPNSLIGHGKNITHPSPRFEWTEKTFALFL
jgi:hypothetical protein